MTEPTVEYATDVATLSGSETGTSNLVLDSAAFDRIMQVAEWMSSGRSTIPAHLQKNPADCGAVIIQAMQWRMNPYAVAQKTYLVNGVLGYEAQLVNAVITSMAPTTGRLQFEWFGAWEKIVGKFKEVESKSKKDDNGYPKKYRVPAWQIADEEGLGVRVLATMKGEDTPRILEILMTQARTRNSTLWSDDPKQQLAYLATKRWARLYCPDVILGVYTPDELDEDRPHKEKDITPRKTATDYAEAAKATTVSSDDAENAVSHLEIIAKESGEAALKDAWNGLTKEMRKAIGVKGRDRLLNIATAIDAGVPTDPDPEQDTTTIDAQTGEVTQGADDDNPFAGV